MPKATIVVGLGFGDEGKGSIVDFLARGANAPLVVRFNGGAQAAHRVVLPDGRSHVFSQFGSGTLAGATTHLSDFVSIEPIGMMREAKHLHTLGISDPFNTLSVGHDCLVITPIHRAANHIREYFRGEERHGSCGIGYGECVSDTSLPLRAGDLATPNALESILREQWVNKRADLEIEFGKKRWGIAYDNGIGLDLFDYRWMSSWLAEVELLAQSLRVLRTYSILNKDFPSDLIFEGAQGVLLDQDGGFNPHTTWSTTTDRNARQILRDIGWTGEVECIGVLRAYSTRHGPGPFPTQSFDLAERLRGHPDEHNAEGYYQGPLRFGWFDIALAEYAIGVCDSPVTGIDSLALTCLDQWDIIVGFPTGPSPRICNGYSVDISRIAEPFPNFCRPNYLVPTIAGEDLADYIGTQLARPIRITSYGPTHEGKRVRLDS